MTSSSSSVMLVPPVLLIRLAAVIANSDVRSLVSWILLPDALVPATSVTLFPYDE